MKRFFLSLVCVAALAVLTGCGGESQPDKPTGGKPRPQGKAETGGGMTAPGSGGQQAGQPEEEAVKKQEEAPPPAPVSRSFRTKKPSPMELPEGGAAQDEAAERKNMANDLESEMAR